jgi:hypothetical protein
MKYYFALQVKRLERKLVEIGIKPVFGFLLMALGFVALSKFLFYKTAFAGWIYSVLVAISVLRLADSKRNDLLRAIFGKSQFWRLRVLENLAIAVPFVLYLFWEGCLTLALAMIPLAVLTVFVQFRQAVFIRIPTPFRKFPFEFIVGFRKALPFLALAGFLLYKGLEVENFNLAASALGLVFLTGMTFYLEPEALYFVWIFKLDATRFLQKKMWQALICVSMLSLPFLLVLVLGFPEKIWIVAGIQLLGYCMLMVMVLAKYSAFPDTMSVPQGIFFGLSLWFPPFLLFSIPVFYIQSKKRLKAILEC